MLQQAKLVILVPEFDDPPVSHLELPDAGQDPRLVDQRGLEKRAALGYVAGDDQIALGQRIVDID